MLGYYTFRYYSASSLFLSTLLFLVPPNTVLDCCSAWCVCSDELIGETKLIEPPFGFECRDDGGDDDGGGSRSRGGSSSIRGRGGSNRDDITAYYTNQLRMFILIFSI